MSFEGCNIHINDECELAIRRALLCSILWMLVNIIIFSNELWWLSIALLSSVSVMWVSGYQNHFPREFPTDQKCLWGLPELLHFQDVIFFFFFQGLYPWERHGTGAEKLYFADSSVLVRSLCHLGEVAQLLFSRAQKRAVVASRGAGVLKCQQNLATGNPAACSASKGSCALLFKGKNDIQLFGH